jgi:superfamily II DNA/RNA helicase
LTITTTPDALDAPSFASFDLPRAAVRVLELQGITTAYPIQAATLRDALAGRDVIGRGRTGSGKTIAFALPAIARLAETPGRTARRPRALVLVPTRELANQVAATFAPLAQAVGLRVATVFGGVGQGPQVRALAAGVDVLVACPGRLEDLVGQRACDLSQVEITVLDEADHLADLGFLPVVRRLLDMTPRRGQRLLFSATIDSAIDAIVKRYLTDPVVHAVDEVAVQIPDTEHHALHVDIADKPAVVRSLASGHGRTVLFTRTKHAAKKLAKQLNGSGIPAVELHGNLSQNARERNLEAFSAGRATVLVATDIAARGIHVDDVALVVHVDPPTEHKAYLHRSGRTARAGARGTVVTVVTADQRRDVAKLARDAGVRHLITSAGPDHKIIESLRGPAAPPRAGIEAAPAPAAPSAGRARTSQPRGTSRTPVARTRSSRGNANHSRNRSERTAR